MKKGTAILLFRRDLRSYDNLALTAASNYQNIVPVYILDENHDPMGSAAKVWLHHSLTELNKEFENKIQFTHGDTKEAIETFVNHYNASAVFFSKTFDSEKISKDKSLIDVLKDKNIEVESFNNSLLWIPSELKRKNGDIFKVFTPFFRSGCLKAPAPRIPLSKPEFCLHPKLKESSADSLNLLPNHAWHQTTYGDHWKAGTSSAKDKLRKFLNNGIGNYKKGRNLVGENFVSKLSPHIAFGEISINDVWHQSLEGEQDKNTEHFRFELGWREFSYYQMYHWPCIDKLNMKPEYNKYPWTFDQRKFDQWKKGETGVPIIDAGMRELYNTGYMNNRARLIVASYLTDYLQIHWKYGVEWFKETLFDADKANNAASWQWVAGSGADPVDYPRIFNPVLQSTKFDSDGIYIRKHVTELENLSSEDIHAPWKLSQEILKKANITLGEEYPRPIVDLEESYLKAKSIYEEYISPFNEKKHVS